MTFAEIQTEVLDDLNLTSTTATTRVGREINIRYKRLVSSLNLDTSKHTSSSQSAVAGSTEITFTSIDKITRIVDTTGGAFRLLKEITWNELREKAAKDSNTPTQYAIKRVGANSVVVAFDVNFQTITPSLRADGYETTSTLSGSTAPAFPEDYHDILVWGAKADELLKMEKPQLAVYCERMFEKRLSELRLYLAKSRYLTRQQGEQLSTTTSPTGSGGGATTIGDTNYTQTGLITFDRDPSFPFAVASGSAKVSNLDADLLDGQHGLYYQVSAPTSLSGTVVVYPPATYGGVGRVFAPSGTEVSTTGTTTSGLQEAITYACTNGFDLEVVGGGDSNFSGAGGVVYQVASGSTLVFPAIQGKRIKFGACTINGQGTTSDPVITFDSMLLCDVEMPATQIVGATRTGHTVVFQPTNNVPIDLIKVIVDTKVHIHTVVGTSATASKAAVKFDVSVNGINNNEFVFAEINGGDYGILVTSPAASKSFMANIVRCPHLHGSVGTNPHVQVGTSSTNAASLFNNDWQLHIHTDSAASKRGYDTWELGGQHRIATVAINVAKVALFLEASATKNVITLQTDEPAGTEVTVDTGASYNTIITNATIAHISDSGTGTSVISQTGWRPGRNLFLGASGLRLADTNASDNLIITPGSNLTADRVLTLTTGDAARTVTLTGNPTLDDWFDQAVKVASTPTFGATTLTGLLTISGAAAGQIAFPGTQNPSAGANTLDDYRENVWTPVITFGGGSTGITYSVQAAWYVKIGQLIVFGGSFTLTSKGSSTGNAAITGLPFTSFGTAGMTSGALFVRPQNLTTISTLQGSVPVSGTSINLTDATGVVVNDTHFQNTTSVDAFFGLYRAAA